MRDELVDEVGGREAGAGDHPRSHAVGIDRSGGQRRDRILVEVAGHGDGGVPGSELIELRPDLGRLDRQVSGVQPHTAQLRACDGDRSLQRFVHVVSVEEDRRVRTERFDLRGEGLALRVVDEGEGMGRGPEGGDPVGHSRFEVRGRGEPCDGCGPCRGHGGALVRAPGSHLRQRTAPGSTRHPGCRRGDRRVVVEDRQDEGLEDDGVAECALHREDGGPGEVHITLRVAADRAGEAVVAQIVESVLIDERFAPEPLQLGIGEAEVREVLERSAGAGDDAVPSARRQTPAEGLEDAATMRRAGSESSLQHRQFVHIGEECARTEPRREFAHAWILEHITVHRRASRATDDPVRRSHGRAAPANRPHPRTGRTREPAAPANRQQRGPAAAGAGPASCEADPMRADGDLGGGHRG